MKIAIICDWFHPRIGGIEVHLQGLAESLLASGHEPEIITATPGNSQGYGFPVHRLEVPVTKRFGLIYTFDAFRQVATILDKGSFDIVHYHYSIWSPLVFGSAYMTKSKHIPTVATCHSMMHYYHILFFLADCLINWSKLPVIFTSVSPSAARVMSKSGRISKIHILPNAVQKSMWLRPGLPRSGDDLTLISVMRFSIRKRAHVLIKMMPEIIRQSGKRRIRLIIVGDGKQRDSLIRLVRSTGLQKTVEFTGMLSQEDIAKTFQQADIFVLPTEKEAFGLAALEARVAGLPVVGMRMSGLQHFIEHGKEGLLAADDAELFRHLLSLIENDDLRQRIAQHNRTQDTIWNWQYCLSRHLEIYHKALQQFGRDHGKDS
jgi:glycosyltransferase involved in cell wall biosynthesis